MFGWTLELTLLLWMLAPTLVILLTEILGDRASEPASDAFLGTLAGMAAVAVVLWAAVVSRVATAWLEADEAGLAWRGWRRVRRVPWNELLELRLTRVGGGRTRPVGIVAVTRDGDELSLSPAVFTAARHRQAWIQAVTHYRGSSLPVVIEAEAAFPYVEIDAPVRGAPRGFGKVGYDPTRPLSQQDWRPAFKQARALAVGTGLVLVVLIAVPFVMAARSVRQENLLEAPPAGPRRSSPGAHRLSDVRRSPRSGQRRMA